MIPTSKVNKTSFFHFNSEKHDTFHPSWMSPITLRKLTWRLPQIFKKGDKVENLWKRLYSHLKDVSQHLAQYPVPV